jgi:outer membrane protein assembly factor BamC
VAPQPARVAPATGPEPIVMMPTLPDFHPPLRLLATALAASTLVGCAAIENTLSGDRVDYRSATVRNTPLDVPPDLTQLARDARFQPQTGAAVSAAGFPAAGSAVPTNTVAVAPQSVTPAAAAAAAQSSAAPRIERSGNQRWLVTGQAPDQVWPRVLAFWKANGFTIAVEQSETGIVETDWAENRAKLPQDLLRRTLGRVLESLYSTGERDRFRTRVERTPAGSEVFISHRGMIEVVTGIQRDNTTWQPRPTDSELEAEFLLRLASYLAGGPARPAAAAQTAAAGAAAAPTPAAAAAGPTQPERARLIAGATPSSLQVDDPFDRAWRRVGLALDRGGFTVEDRDRVSGLYFVRFVPAQAAPTADPGLFARLFSSRTDAQAAQRVRIQVKGEGDSRSTVNVVNADGAADTSESAQRIVALLLDGLK